MSIPVRIFRDTRVLAGLAILVVSSLSSAQTEPTSHNASKQKESAEANSKLVRWTGVLNELVIDARTLSDNTLRSDALNSVADAYWEVSPAKSKELFTTALDLALSIETEKDRLLAISRVISSAARREAQLGKLLTQKVLDRTKGNNQALGASLSLLEFDTKTSEAIAIASSSFGASFDAAWLIFQLKKRDPDAADRVYLAYLQNDNSKELTRLLWLAGYPFGYGEAFGGNKDPTNLLGMSGFEVPGLAANSALANAFLRIADESIISTLNFAREATPEEAENLNSLVFFTVGYLLAETLKYKPDIYSRWAILQNDLGERINPNHREAILRKLKDIASDRERIHNRSPNQPDYSDEELESVEHLSSSCERDQLYAKAAFHFSYKANFKKALTVADRISALQLRSGVIQFIYYDVAALASTPGPSMNLDDALIFARRVESFELSALLLVRVAKLMEIENRADQARETIVEAIKKAERVEEPSIRAAVLLAAEKNSPESDADTRFKLLTGAIAAANRSKDIKIDQLLVRRRVDIGCDSAKPAWYGQSLIRLDLVESLVRFSQVREDEAFQLALTLEQGVNRIKTSASIVRSIMKRTNAQRNSQRKSATH